MPNKTTIKDWHNDDRPREKLLSKGRKSLTNAELIAILLGSGNSNETAVGLARRILQTSDNSLQQLGKKQIKDLLSFRGVGEAKAVSITAALELGRRRAESNTEKRVKVTSSRDAYNAVAAVLADLPHEEFWMLILDRSNHVIKKQLISSGGVSGTVVDPKLIFKHAIDAYGSAIILGHNHPSGNLKASAADREITKKVQEGGKFLDIQVLDHIIVGNGDYLSFADEGMM